MENRPAKKRPVGDTPLPDLTAANNPAAANAEDEVADAFNIMGSTRVVEGAEYLAAGERTRLPEDTEIQDPEESQEVTTLGNYDLVKKLGEGAMGEVWLARHKSSGQQVALKVLFPHIAKNPKLVARLEREGRVMGQLDHPNIVQAFEVGEDQDWHFIAMEYVEGESLQKWIDRLGRLELGDALNVTLACARALEYAHEKGMFHRDIKPENVLITRRGDIKVADLGMVKTLDEDMALTQTGHAVGTPWYMPLEQARNAKDTDGRCDIYALGCMLYCMLTGNPPFIGKTLVEVIEAKEKGTFPPARQVNADVPERLDLVLIKMAAKLPKGRYPNCTELIRDLESLELANSRLSFLDGKPSKRAVEKKEPAKPGSSVDMVADIWYLRVHQAGGEKALRKLTTPQLKKMLEGGTIDPTARVSRQPDDGYRALATFKEFQGAALAKQAKKSADKQAVKYRSLYQKIDEKERQRELAGRKIKKDETPSYYSTLFRFIALGGLALLGIGILMFFLGRLLGI